MKSFYSFNEKKTTPLLLPKGNGNKSKKEKVKKEHILKLSATFNHYYCFIFFSLGESKPCLSLDSTNVLVHLTWNTIF